MRMNKMAKIPAEPPTDYPHYAKDGYGWAMAQAAIIRAGRLDSIDWENVAEEIESVGRSERSRYKNHLIQILIHLLKWEAQPERRGMSWWLSIANGRIDALDTLEDNPSLKPELVKIHDEAMIHARKKAALQMRVDISSIDQIVISRFDAFERDIPRPEGD
jgi:Domain of unknown function DUF29